MVVVNLDLAEIETLIKSYGYDDGLTATVIAEYIYDRYNDMGQYCFDLNEYIRRRMDYVKCFETEEEMNVFINDKLTDWCKEDLIICKCDYGYYLEWS